MASALLPPSALSQGGGAVLNPTLDVVSPVAMTSTDTPVGESHLGSRPIDAGAAILKPVAERSAGTSKGSTSGRLTTERLWRQYFADPCQWADNRNSKANLRAPDFKHKITKESLWIDGWYNPGWVKDMLKKMESRSVGMDWTDTSTGEARPNSEECGLVESAINCKASVNASESQELLENSDWDLMSLEETLTSLERLTQPPSVEDLMYILQKCRKERNLAYAKRLHAYMCKWELDTHDILGNYLVPMLADCGSISSALRVFKMLVDPNIYSWNSLITGYIECGKSLQAFKLYQKMQQGCVHPTKHTFAILLKACASLKNVEKGREIHVEIARKGLEGDCFSGITLVDMYAKCGLLAKAREVFDKFPVRNVVSWTALIAGYVEHRLDEEALNSFKLMQLEGVAPNALTFVCILKVCGSIRAIDKAQEIHAEIARRGLERDSFVGTSLVDMYAKCASLAKAQETFDKLPVRSVVSWNALIAGYAQHGLGEQALDCFKQMQLGGVSPSCVTFLCGLKACGSVRAIDKGCEIHSEIARKGWEKESFLGSTLVNMYAKFGLLAKAQEVFDKLPVRNTVSWSALVAGHVEHGLGDEGLDCFKQMQLEGVSPNVVMFVCSLKACGSIGARVKGREIHAEVARKGQEKNTLVGSTLVNMYAKCGSLAEAQEAFNKIPARNVVCWTALIAGYAEQGDCEEAWGCFQQMQWEGIPPNVVSWNALIIGYAQLGKSEIVFGMLERMQEEGINPDGVSFLGALTVCNHAGLVVKGQKYFQAMSKDYGITPTIEHHTCIIDIVGRAGQLDEAVAMVEKMPFQPNLAVWHTILAACLKWGNVELGRQAFEHAVHLDEKDVAAYVLMSNIYAGANMQEDEMKIEAMRVKGQAWKKLGQSWTEVDGIVHGFGVGNTRHLQSKYTYAKLEDFYLKMREEGYIPNLLSGYIQ